MKMILSAFVLAASFVAVSTVAQAMPSVGDSATFSGVATQQGQKIPFQTVIALTQFDASQNAFVSTTTTTFAGSQPRVEQKSIPAKDLLTDAMVANLVSNCPANGGISETLTVPAGNFNTCRITDQNGNVFNVGAVSFGIVKTVQDNSQLTLELMSFQAGH